MEDSRFPDKLQRSFELYAAARRGRRGRVSTQVLKEYFSAATGKLGVDRSLARRRVEYFSRLAVIPETPVGVLAAIDLAAEHRLSFWDALILEAALRGGCEVLYSEDMQHGRRFGGLEVVNPFL